ncbi:MAG: Holliday junction resolvase RuvX [Cytophagales bacterium]|nr:Holliday junction resolvase RuvX [Cytophagales bacterium]
MGRIVAIDYGLKRVGIAVTDPQQIIATPLTTIKAQEVVAFLKAYEQQEAVEAFVIGLPKRLNNTESLITIIVKKFIHLLQQTFPRQEIFQQDERYTSKIALAGMIQGGYKKKDRRNKANLDKLSATILLQSFLERYPR